MPRLFVAIDLPSTAKQGLERVRDGSLDARWTPLEQHHLTLRFVGNVDEPSAEDLAEALRGFQSPALEVGGEGLDVFPSRRRPRVLVARVAPSDALTALQMQVDRAVVDRGLAKESKPFNPHVTIARIKGARPREVRHYMKGHEDFRLQPFSVQQFQLYESLLGPSGAVHTVRARFLLGDGAPRATGG